MSRLGLSVDGKHVHAVLVHGSRIVWAGQAPCSSPDEAEEAIAHLAAEAPQPTPRCRVVLGRDIVQLRSLSDTPIKRAEVARRFVALEAPRLFRGSGREMVTDAALVPVGRKERVLWAAAADAALVGAVERGCAQAGLVLETIGIAAELLPYLVRDTGSEIAIPNGTRTEWIAVRGGRAWRSRHVSGAVGPPPAWREPLASLGARAKPLAAAFAAAARRPRFSLLAAATQAARAGRARRSAWMRLTLAVALVLGAAALRTGRWLAADHAAARELAILKPRLDVALTQRTELREAQDALGTLARAESARSRNLELLAALTHIAGDSLVLVSYSSFGDSLVRVAGYTPMTAHLAAALERWPNVRSVRLEGATNREAVPGSPSRGVWDRFAMTIQMVSWP